MQGVQKHQCLSAEKKIQVINFAHGNKHNNVRKKGEPRNHLNVNFKICSSFKNPYTVHVSLLLLTSGSGAEGFSMTDSSISSSLFSAAKRRTQKERKRMWHNHHCLILRNLHVWAQILGWQVLVFVNVAPTWIQPAQGVIHVSGVNLLCNLYLFPHQSSLHVCLFCFHFPLKWEKCQALKSFIFFGLFLKFQNLISIITRFF